MYQHGNMCTSHLSTLWSNYSRKKKSCHSRKKENKNPATVKKISHPSMPIGKVTIGSRRWLLVSDHHHIAEKTTTVCRSAATASLVVVLKLPASCPENSIFEGGRPAASGFPPDFRLHRPGRKHRDN